jgi:hypothetical protein
MTLKYARDVAMNDVEIAWDDPHAATWKNGLVVDQVQDLLLEDMRIDAPPGSKEPVLTLNDGDGVMIRQSRIASVHLSGNKSRGVRVVETDATVTTDPGVTPAIVK